MTDTPLEVNPEEIAALREPDGNYGDRGYLNGCWDGRKARALLEGK